MHYVALKDIFFAAVMAFLERFRLDTKTRIYKDDPNSPRFCDYDPGWRVRLPDDATLAWDIVEALGLAESEYGVLDTLESLFKFP